MAKATPTYLKLYNEARPASSGHLGDFWPGLDKLCRAFERATGWPLECHPEPAEPTGKSTILWSAPAVAQQLDGEQLHVGVASAEGVASSPSPIDLQATVDLAATIGQLLADLARARQALWKREAELAAGVPLALRTNEAHLAQRLQSSLQAAAQTVCGVAAALYLLDETTTHLKLRSVWGLPQERLLLPPRELSKAAADLEALLGHAIVLDKTVGQAAFNPPEPASAAVCVPVSSATAPLGTLWVFCDRPRTFKDHEVNMVEIVAGRLAAELEREMLVASCADYNQTKRQFSAAERWQGSRLPHVSPLNDLWQVAGWAQAAGELYSEFYDWFVCGDDSLGICLGGARQEGIEAALNAATLRTAARCEAVHTDDPAEWLSRVNQTLTAGAPGDQPAALFVALADAAAPTVRIAAAGDLVIWKISVDGTINLAPAASHIGCDWRFRPVEIVVTLEPNDLLLVFSEGASKTLLQAGEPGAEEELLNALTAHRRQPASVLVEIVHDRLTTLAGAGPLVDCTALVLKRRA